MVNGKVRKTTDEGRPLATLAWTKDPSGKTDGREMTIRFAH
jgi:hypothetical protein